MKLTAILMTAIFALSAFSGAVMADGDPKEPPKKVEAPSAPAPAETAASSPAQEAPAVAAPAPAPAYIPPASPAAPACDYAFLIGQKDTDIDRAQFGDRVVRSLKPGQMVTMEYLEGRINLNVDDAGTILSVTCG